MDIESKLLKILSEVLNSPGVMSLDKDAPLLDSVPELDSFSVVNLIDRIGNDFNIEFDDDDLTEETFSSINSLTNCVKAKLN